MRTPRDAALSLLKHIKNHPDMLSVLMGDIEGVRLIDELWVAIGGRPATCSRDARIEARVAEVQQAEKASAEEMGQ